MPVPSPYISNKTSKHFINFYSSCRILVGYQFGDTSIAERNYQFKHFRDIVNHYGLEQANFEVSHLWVIILIQDNFLENVQWESPKQVGAFVSERSTK